MRTRMFGAVAVVLLAVASGASAGIVNGNFSTGDFTGWSHETGATPGVISIVTSPAPYDGQYCAEILAPGPTTAYEAPCLRQSFSANAGDVISFEYQSSIAAPSPNGTQSTDFAIMSYIDQTDTITVANLLPTTQWQSVSYQFVTSGMFTIEFFSVVSPPPTRETPCGSATLYVADVQLTPAPEPATLSLLGFGLIGLIARRKRAVK